MDKNRVQGASVGRAGHLPRSPYPSRMRSVDPATVHGILLVEQNVSRALALVQRAYVLESGKVIMHGTSAELANNKQVQAAYLGI